MARTPVMLVVEVGAVATTVLSIADPSVLGWMVTVWLWLTVLFATLAESVAEGRGKAQAASLRALQQETTARRVRAASDTAEVHRQPHRAAHRRGAEHHPPPGRRGRRGGR